MLKIEVPISPEGWNEETQEFVDPETRVLELEHSLVSISLWESKWKKAFLSGKEKTAEETLDYIRCMTLNEVEPDVYDHLTRENIIQINKYIEDPMTATVLLKDKNGGKSKDTPTSELIYYWMIANTIPVEFQYWHINRLLTLIRVCGMKNNPPKGHRSKGDIARSYAEINKANRARFNSKG